MSFSVTFEQNASVKIANESVYDKHKVLQQSISTSNLARVRFKEFDEDINAQSAHGSGEHSGDEDELL